jgi:hypothetical protein
VGLGSFLGIQQGSGSGGGGCLGAAGAVGSITAAKPCGSAASLQNGKVCFVSLRARSGLGAARDAGPPHPRACVGRGVGAGLVTAND